MRKKITRILMIRLHEERNLPLKGLGEQLVKQLLNQPLEELRLEQLLL